MKLELFPERLTRTIESLLDYYPGRETYDDFCAHGDILKDTFVTIMYCFAELKAYLNSYRQSLPHERQTDPRYDIGNCGDEKIADLIGQRLEFGTAGLGQNAMRRGYRIRHCCPAPPPCSHAPG